MTWEFQESVVFQQQLRDAAHYYKQEAGKAIANRFLDDAEKSLSFIKESPLSCPAYNAGRNNEDLTALGFRKWMFSKFPYTILFRINNADIIIVEALYNQSMDIQRHLLGGFTKH